MTRFAKHRLLKNTIWIYLSLIWCLAHAKAQVHDRYPSLFFQYYNNLKLINPAEVSLGSKVNIDAGSQFFTGDFSNIGSYYATSSYMFSGNDSSVSKQAIGLNLIGEREGSIFSNNRLYGSYSLRRKLSDEYELAMGLAVGMASYVIQATPNSAGGGAQAFDGNVGLSVSSSYIKFGIAINQFANNTLTPLVERLVLKRFFEGYIQHYWDISASTQLKSILHTRIQSGLQLRPNLTEMLMFRELFAFGFTYTFERQYGFLIGLEKIPLLQGNIKTYFSYHLPVNHPNVAQNMNTVVIGLSYQY